MKRLPNIATTVAWLVWDVLRRRRAVVLVQIEHGRINVVYEIRDRIEERVCNAW